MEKLFQLSKNGTNVKTEVVAGLSTFMTMAYIVQLNPFILTGSWNDPALWNAVFLATILSASIGTLLMAFLANKPFALAPGMGLNSYFATVVASIAATTGASHLEAFHGGLAIILISGILFTLLTLFKIREKIVEAIPKSIRLGISAGIGFMLINIGLSSNALIFYGDGESISIMDFFTLGASQTKDLMGGAYPTMILYLVTLFVGVFAIAVLSHKKVRGAILFGIVAASAVYWTGSFVLGENPFAALAGSSFVPPFADMFRLTFFRFNFKTLFGMGVFGALMTVVTFCLVDMFDTIGTLLGTAKKANMLDGQGKLENMNRAMLSDSLATCVGSCTGTSTVTTFVESAAGVEEGGRTGLTSLVAGLCFLACMFFAPVASLIPAPATSAALVFVGILMVGVLKEVDYHDLSSCIPVVLMMVFMMLTSGIGTGIGVGLIAYTVIKLCTGRFKEVSLLTVVLSLLFIGKFFVVF